MKRKSATHKSYVSRSVYSFGLVLIVISFLNSTTFALDPLGPPGSNLRKGEYKIGINLALSSQDIETAEGNWTQYIDGAATDSGIAILETVEDFETYRAYTTFGLPLTHSWEVFLRLGGTTAELGDEFWSDGEEFESNAELAIGGGIRATFYEELALKIGGIAQANWSEFDGKVEASHWPGPEFLDMEMFEIQAALGATYMFSDRLSIYGGPFAHVIYGDLSYVYNVADVDNLETWRLEWDIEKDINYGGYFGARILLKRDCSLNIEYQHTSNANAIGASLMWKL
jgi:hypothetical protein